MINKVKLLLVLLACVFMSGCGPTTANITETPNEISIKKSYDGSIRNYVELEDGTFQWNDNSYKYKLIIEGRVENSANYITYTFLSNIESISFEEAHKAAGFGTKNNDYFALTEAVCVDMKTEYLTN